MRKGLNLTLMTVAIALVSVQAMAMAPTISDIPSPVVGSAEAVTIGGKYVYPDALNLNDYVSDDVTSTTNLMWTYSGVGGTATSNYRINGVAPIDLASVDPTSPTTAKIINRNDLDPVTNTDGKANTITIRNNVLSPLATPSQNNDTGIADGVIAAQTQAVTFFCSDGSAVSSKTLFFYTEKGGVDRLSGLVPSNWKPVKDDSMTWTSTNKFWRFDNLIPGITTSTFPAGGTTGMCMTTPLAADAFASLVSPMPYFSLAANQVYRIKMRMNGTQLAAGAVPFWDMVLENYESTTAKGYNLYAMDTQVWDSQGSANAITPSAGGTWFTMFWTPPAVQLASWTTNAFTSAVDAGNDPMLRFRIMDNANAATGSASRQGSLCIQQILIESIQLSKRTLVTQNIVNINTFAQVTATPTTGNNVDIKPLTAGQISVAFNSGAVTITPVGGGQTLELTEMHPAATTNEPVFSAPTFPNYADHYPIAWQAGKIYQLEVDMSAPTANDQAHPWDAYYLSMDVATNELNTDAFITSNKGLGQPQFGSPQPYTFYYYSGNGSNSSYAALKNLRWRVRLVNVPQANFPNGETTNTGAVKISRVNVSIVDFK